VALLDVPHGFGGVGQRVGAVDDGGETPSLNEPGQAGMASGINSTFRQVGIATGITALFANRCTRRWPTC
jgi:hypothetical protein